MIGRSSERWSGISVLAARHDDDADDDSLIQYMCVYVKMHDSTYANRRIYEHASNSSYLNILTFDSTQT